MANTFHIWKDGKYNGDKTEWLELTGNEFYEYVTRSENKDRLFVWYYNDPDDHSKGYFKMEVTVEAYKKWDAERKKNERNEDVLLAEKKKRYLEGQDDEKLNKKAISIPSLISFDSIASEDGEYTFHDVIADDRNNFDEVFKKALLEALYKESRGFSAMERELIDWLYFNSSDEKTENEFGRKYNLTQQAISYQKKKIIKKLKKFL